MDDGFGGYMSPHLKSDGTPVCHEQVLCGTVASEQAFRFGGSEISPGNQTRLREFFERTEAVIFSIVAHDDTPAASARNAGVLQKQAASVASVARNAGARLSEVRAGDGEAMGDARQDPDGAVQGRRVEILCWR